MAREALKAGQFDRAQDLSAQADKANSTGKWGIFDDTPESVNNDIKSARAKSDKAEAERLTKAAMDLANKPTKTAAERLANLDQAYAMSDRATALQGSSDLIDDVFGGPKPDKLKKEIDAARIQLKRTNPDLARMQTPTPPTASGRFNDTAVRPASHTAMPGAPSGVVPASATAPATPEKTAAMKLVAEGRKALTENRLGEAKMKAAYASQYKVQWSRTEDTPDALLKDVMADASTQINGLVKAAKDHAAKGETTKADAAMAVARKVAGDIGIPSQEVDAQFAAKPMTTVTPPAPAIAAPVMPAPALPTPPSIPNATPTGGIAAPIVPPMVTAPAPTVATPALPTPSLPTPSIAPAAPTLPVAPAIAAPVLTAPSGPMDVNAKQILAQAENELRRGDLDTARKLAVMAHNADPASKDDAQKLLRAIDAERTTMARKDTDAAFKNATALFQAKQHEQALGVLRVIDIPMLTPEQQTQALKMAEACTTEIAKIKALSVVPTGGGEPAKPLQPSPLTTGTQPQGAGLSDQVKALAEVEFQKLRSKGLEVQSKSQEAFNRGETDIAIQMLTDYAAEVRASTQSVPRQNMLLPGVERRLETFRIMKRQMDFVSSEAKTKREVKDRIVGGQLLAQQKREELSKKAREVHELTKAHKYREAEALALQLKTLDPDDPTISALYELAKKQRRVDDAQKLRTSKEEMVFNGLNAAEKEGVFVDVDNPIHVDVKRQLIAMGRGNGADPYTMRTWTPIEREIEMRLDKPMSINFDQAPLKEAIDKIREVTQLNITTDDANIQDEQIDLSKVIVSEKLKDLSTRDVLAVVLGKARLKAVTENNVVMVTTEKKARGKLYTKVFSVMDLVTPIPDFHLAPHQDLKQALNRGVPGWDQVANASGLTGGLNNGQLVSQAPWSASSDGSRSGVPFSNGGGGTLENRPIDNSGARLGTQGTARAHHAAKLQEMVTKLVKPYSWDGLGGSGKLFYYDIGGALVINQTADVIREVQDLLESLRRLQETSVAVEVRVISLSEAFFERVGVDFQMNVSTTGSSRESFERSLTSGAFRPEPFLNSINERGVVVGWNPTANGFTPDLNVPIRPNTFGLGLPGFGGYPGPGNGGLSLGLAFLNDIQVYMFMEAAQGDRRVNVMQAPKVTLFNGQTSTVFVSDVQFFTIGLQVVNVGGQTVYLPTNVPIPIGSAPPPPGSTSASPGISVTVQAIVSSDRRFVRMNLAPSLTSLASATVPLFPITTFITPVFEGGSQGVPIPFTQFFQQPSITNIDVQTTVAVPDGGTVVLGGLKSLAEARNEFGPPVLSSIPYVNRLFRNQGIGRETRHIMIMVTPRIIIQSEEEFNQTQQGPQGTPGGLGI